MPPRSGKGRDLAVASGTIASRGGKGGERRGESPLSGLTSRDNKRLIRILEGTQDSGAEQPAAPGGGKQNQGNGRVSKGLRIAQVGLGCAAAWACFREKFLSAAMLGGLAILPEVMFDNRFGP